MADERILITGATGNVGSATLLELTKHPDKSHFEIVAGVRNLSHTGELPVTAADQVVPLDFTDSATFDRALAGVNRVLLVRPPNLSDADRFMKPFVSAMKKANVRRVVFLSMQGVEHLPTTPHYKIEKLIVEAGLEFTFLRPSFYMQNLCSFHRDEIRLRNELFVPAGKGRINFVDVRDVAAVAAQALTSQNAEYFNRGYELTGGEALTYTDIAKTLTTILGRPIQYRNPSVLRFIWQKWRVEHRPLNYVLIISALYSSVRLGKAAETSSDIEHLLARPPIPFRQFAADYCEVWH
ncbi:SDR family oxidoreductase [Spirosoma terrae]|uniref:SDR family oxidoreductase n=1 Tax=Spirosoma terrae TaxID=1968276 RepID=A0A6L9LDW6_9BACT|nr:SDR family oxidoreductase [Spirosoma terrae]NDU94919.1 SDR family oxidoreductase [Spirosoma terrae]